MHYADYKTIIGTSNTLNVYRGCSHGCIYCDSRSKCYQIKHVFEDIEVKRNASQILEQQLKKRRKPCMIRTGSMCDPYLPLESELKQTRACLEVIEQCGFGVSVLTKSTLVLRDLDLFKRINEKTKCVVQMTLTTFDESLCRKIEPNVATTRERVHVLEEIHKAGIPTVVWLCPVLPFINDTEENLRGILDYCIKAKVNGILFWGCGVTLRDGDRDYFYGRLDKDFPGIKQKYIKTFGNKYECISPNAGRLYKIFNETCERHGILYKHKEIWNYLNELPPKQKQISFFDN